MKLLLALALVSLPAQASETISTERVEALQCLATNALGTSTFELRNGDVHSRTNGSFEPYRLSSAGNSAQFGFAYVSLAAGWHRAFVSFAFPGQQLTAGRQQLNGVLFFNANVNPFAPVSRWGTPWASVSCDITIRDR